MIDYPALLHGIARPEPRLIVQSDDSSLVLLGRAGDEVPRYVLVSSEIQKIDHEFIDTVVMDPSVFMFYLCFVDPLEYLKLLRGRRVFSGADPLSTPYALTKYLFRDSVLHYAAQMLTFPYRREIPTLSYEQFRGTLYSWFLQTLRYLEDGHMDFQYHTLREYFGRRHLETETTDRFQLMRGIADDLCPHLFVPTHEC